MGNGAFIKGNNLFNNHGRVTIKDSKVGH
jgi:hypothetical protein